MSSQRREHTNWPENADAIRAEARAEMPPWLNAALNAEAAPADLPTGYFERFITRVQDRVHPEMVAPSPALDEALKTPLPATIAGGSVAYFRTFVQRLWLRLRPLGEHPAWLNNALNAAAYPAMPVDEKQYFGTFAERVQNRIARETEVPTWLQSALDEPQETVPTDYFATFAERIQNRIAEEETAIPTWLDNALQTHPPEAPEPAYFETFSDQVSARIAETERPKLAVIRRWTPRLQWAVAAGFVMLIGTITVLNLPNASVPQSLETIYAELETEDVEALYENLSGGDVLEQDLYDAMVSTASDPVLPTSSTTPRLMLSEDDLFGEIAPEEEAFILSKLDDL